VTVRLDKDHMWLTQWDLSRAGRNYGRLSGITRQTFLDRGMYHNMMLELQPQSYQQIIRN